MAVAIVDYGLGNLRSLMNALDHVGAEASLVAEPDRLADFDHIILPGVGAIAEAMATLKARNLDEALVERARSGIPFLGVCLGMQLLCTRSFEDGEYAALDLIAADVVPLPRDKGLKVPHIGWNGVEPEKSHPLLEGIEPGSDVYFVHSYYVDCADQADRLATSNYGVPFASMVARDNVMGAQFHPEKSQFIGLRMLQNFVEL